MLTKVIPVYVAAALVVGMLGLTRAPASAQLPPLLGGSGHNGDEATGHVPVSCDFITSGGYVFTDIGEHANFGAHGGCKNGDFWGHVNYVDHAFPKLHLNSTEITGYLDPFPPSNARDICGIARTDLFGAVRFRVRLIDNGEPGNSDQFGIRLSNGYVVSTRVLGGGNVQLHEPNPSTVGPDPAPDEATMCGGVAAP